MTTAIGYYNGDNCTETLTSNEHSGHGHQAALATHNYGENWFLPSAGQWNLILKGLAMKANASYTQDLY